MNLQKTYTALLTSDLASAEGWYTKLLGRAPDFRPMDTLVQWELSGQGGVALSTDDDIAGRGVMFLVVDDVAAERRRLVILTATCSRWRRRPRGPIRRHDRACRTSEISARVRGKGGNCRELSHAIIAGFVTLSLISLAAVTSLPGQRVT
jgi:hypothetical protein